MDRWLTARGVVARDGWTVTLPTDEQWRRAYSGDGDQNYPWGAEYRIGCANVDESGVGGTDLSRTGAVGLYPSGAAACGALDMAGNVWEWCRTKDKSESDEIDASDDARVLRGGSWGNTPDRARSGGRGRAAPVARVSNIGFRVVRAPYRPLTTEGGCRQGLLPAEIAQHVVT